MLKNDYSKNISRSFSGAVEGSVGSVQLQIVPCSSLYLLSRSVRPFQCLINVNYRVLICCTCHFQSGSLFSIYFGFLCLQVSSVSIFHPVTRQRWSLIQVHLFSCVVGKEESCKQISLAFVGTACSVWTTQGLSQLTAACASPLQVALQRCCPKQAVYFVHFPGLSCSGSGSRVCHKAQNWLGVRFVPIPGPNSSGDQVLGKRKVPGGPWVLITCLVLAAWFLGCTTRGLSQVCCVSLLW